MISIRFTYLTGTARQIFRGMRLCGSWDGWAETPMLPVVAEDGCPAFEATVTFDDAHAGEHVEWGVRADGPQGGNVWAINLEVPRAESVARTRSVTLPAPGTQHHELYRMSYGRYLGAQKTLPAGDPDGAGAARFAVWAPHAQRVQVVFGRSDSGYIADSGAGIDPAMPVLDLVGEAGGVWASIAPGPFARYVGAPYMFRLVTREGRTVYRTDIFSRWQIGRGDQNPHGSVWVGGPQTLDGGVSCSVVVDQNLVRAELEPRTDPPTLVSDDVFWSSEFVAGKPLPTRVEDLIIYELHVAALGFNRAGAGQIVDAVQLIPYLVDLGVNAVELMPMSETSGTLSWGYGDTHHLVIESSSGGRDAYKYFVRECHRNGIVVIQDVVYNHFDANAERAEWGYDSDAPEQNGYYWYEGATSDHSTPRGGYLDNRSSGYTPNFREECVRQLFITSAVEFLEEFHVDGFRVDLTQAIHRDNTLVDNGWSVPQANLYGQKFLREWTRTLRMLRPGVILVAEDHSGWRAVTENVDQGGLGFTARWFADFYHDLIGDSEQAGSRARLLRRAGYGTDDPLPMGQFADALWRSREDTVVYHESHDEAGNDRGSLRTVKSAVNDAPLVGATRQTAEARARAAAGLSLLSPGTPMFFMGEEIAAQRRYTYDNVLGGKEDLHGERVGLGAEMFRFYQDVIRLTRDSKAMRSRNIDVLHAVDASRVIAFTRTDGTSQSLVVASLSNTPCENGYVIHTEASRLHGTWSEVFNSDSSVYGGRNVGNFGASVSAVDGRITLRLPANGFIVLQRV